MISKTAFALARLLLLAATLGVSGCAGQSTANAQDYPALAARAEREIRRADKDGFLWLHTESYLEESREAYEAGDVDKARTLAQKALDEALLAQKQAAAARTVKPDFTYKR